MKHFLWILALVSASAVADSDSDLATAFIQNTLANQPIVELVGTTEQGQPCALYFTDKQFGLYFVVVGFQDTEDMNDYIGISTTELTDVHVDSSKIRFHSDTSWGNASSRNTVTIKVDCHGLPVRATGVSDIQSIVCNLN